jgi:hypothetical protein
MHEVLGLYSLLHDWTISNHALNMVFLNAYPGLTVSLFSGDDHGLYMWGWSFSDVCKQPDIFKLPFCLHTLPKQKGSLQIPAPPCSARPQGDIREKMAKIGWIECNGRFVTNKFLYHGFIYHDLRVKAALKVWPSSKNQFFVCPLYLLMKTEILQMIPANASLFFRLIRKKNNLASNNSQQSWNLMPFIR